MNDSPIRPTNPFLRAANEIRITGQITRPAQTDRPERKGKARLNYVPEDGELKGLVERALTAMSRGVHWVRGSILNLLV